MPVRQQNNIFLAHFSGTSSEVGTLGRQSDFELIEAWCDLVKLLVFELKNYEGRHRRLSAFRKIDKLGERVDHEVSPALRGQFFPYADHGPRNFSDQNPVILLGHIETILIDHCSGSHGLRSTICCLYDWVTLETIF
jgi:hypothetical protein